MWYTLIKENFQYLIETYIRKPHVIIAIILLFTTGYLFKKYHNALEDKNNDKTVYKTEIDSLKTEILYLKKSNAECQEIKITLDTLFKETIINKLKAK